MVLNGDQLIRPTLAAPGEWPVILRAIEITKKLAEDSG